MPSKKKKYNARFPAGRIKKIMQTDEEVGKVAQAVPIIISRTLELFVESLLTKSMQITQARNAKTLTPSHMKQCIQSESRFDFLKDLVKNIPDASIQEDNENNAIFEATYIRGSETDAGRDAPQDSGPSSTDPYQPFPPPLSRPPHPPFFDQSPSSSRTPVIQYVPKVSPPPAEQQKLHVKIDSRQLPVPQLRPVSKTMGGEAPVQIAPADTVPPLVPIAGVAGVYQGAGDSLCIDEDYDN